MKRVLYRANSYNNWGADAAFAARLANALDAELTGLYVVPVAALPSSAYDGGVALTAYLSMVDDERRTAEESAPRFIEFAADMGARAATWITARGSPVMEVGYAALSHDVIVSEIETAASPNPIKAASMVLHARRPCIFVPREYTARAAELETVAFGWNGATESIRALHDASPIIERARTLLVLEGEHRSPGVSQPLFDPSQHFRGTAIACDRRSIARDSDVGPALLYEASRGGADLLVIGAYSRTRLSEWVLGGVSEFMLHASTIPIFVSH